MTAALSDRLTLTGDELHVVASRVGMHEFPTVLAVRSPHATVDQRNAARDRAARKLASRKLIDGGSVHPELVTVLQALQWPDRELAMRLVTPDGIARVSVTRRGALCVLARRIADETLLRIIGYHNDVRDVVSAVVAELPKAKPADIEPVAAPLQEVAESLSGTHDAVELGDRARALGAEPRAAMLLGAALGSRQAFAEIVYYTLTDAEGRISRAPAAVALFYTSRGRVVAAPSGSPSGDAWVTLKAGSDHAVAQAIFQLIGLAEESWSTTSGMAG
ncbi:hypothetical protein A5714_24395 [Mycobacterium sp. E2462]|uniref:ESX secretion-associated protein EspG n=1 Tax=Mycobacterium sp. E2462 TaxID=1834133 RepID=UPI0007FD018E|nr:ESX secretion-associated protein EspG [Mycobacterium sp. E2462]OBI05537.1 hypothetical protein A5714_24395 [Mycobacterium sp. E2462]